MSNRTPLHKAIVPDEPIICPTCNQDMNDPPRNSKYGACPQCGQGLPSDRTPLHKAEVPDEPTIDYDHSIHSNPDAQAWAQFFCKTAKELIHKGHDPQEMLMDCPWMLGWFSNAMMAMHDWMQQNGWKKAEVPDDAATGEQEWTEETVARISSAAFAEADEHGHEFRAIADAHNSALAMSDKPTVSEQEWTVERVRRYSRDGLLSHADCQELAADINAVRAAAVDEFTRYHHNPIVAGLHQQLAAERAKLVDLTRRYDSIRDKLWKTEDQLAAERERKEGHSALRVKGNKLEKFDPHPAWKWESVAMLPQSIEELELVVNAALAAERGKALEAVVERDYFMAQTKELREKLAAR